MAMASLFIRLYLDENIYPDLAEAIRQRGFDCLSTSEADMLGRTDAEQLTYAAQTNRAILTFNIKDFVPLGLHWLAADREHAGIVLVEPMDRRQFGELLRRILRLLNNTTAEEIRNQIRYLPSST